jgi:hypothetical protein
MKKENILKNIPIVTNDKIQLYVHNKFVHDMTSDELNAYRRQIVDYIHETDDISILDDFYFVGHKETRGEMSDEIIKINMDRHGNLSDFPYECGQVRRDMLYLMAKQREWIDKKLDRN